jgi:hypothetical protein
VKFNQKQLLTGLITGLAIPVVLILGWGAKDVYDVYRDRQHSITITGPVQVWEHHDLYYHQDARVLTVLEKGAQVKVLRMQGGIDWASIRVRLADGREGYIEALFRDSQNYILR